MNGEITNTSRAIRIITGKPEVVEAEINAIIDEYTPQSFTYSVVKDELLVSAILVNKSEARKAHLATIRNLGPRN
jgi:hypothetical protein